MLARRNLGWEQENVEDLMIIKPYPIPDPSCLNLIICSHMFWLEGRNGDIPPDNGGGGDTDRFWPHPSGEECFSSRYCGGFQKKSAWKSPGCCVENLGNQMTKIGFEAVDTVPKNLNIYSQKENCAAWFPISTFMCLGAIYIFPRLVLFA